MNHIMFSMAFEQLIGASLGRSVAAPPGADAVDMSFRRVALIRSSAEPLVFQGRLMIDDLTDESGLRLYETEDGGLVAVLEVIAPDGDVTRRIFAAETAEELCKAIELIDPLAMVSISFPGEGSARESLRELHLRIEAVTAALTRFSSILNVDVSDAIVRLAALCDGDQTWLQ